MTLIPRSQSPFQNIVTPLFIAPVLGESAFTNLCVTGDARYVVLFKPYFFPTIYTFNENQQVSSSLVKPILQIHRYASKLRTSRPFSFI